MDNMLIDLPQRGVRINMTQFESYCLLKEDGWQPLGEFRTLRGTMIGTFYRGLVTRRLAILKDGVAVENGLSRAIPVAELL